MISLQAGYAVVVDDEPANRDFLERLLQQASFKVTGASNAKDALHAARTVPQLALAVIDWELPDSTGLDLLKLIRQENPEATLVIATMHDERSMMSDAFRAGCNVFLVKPHGFMELFQRLKLGDTNQSLLNRVIIDQHGARAFRGAL
jgi:DNA-binding response OmpR family regulator